MGRRKAWRKAAVLNLPNVVDVATAVRRGGVVRCFRAARPLVLELGCGRGETSVELARARPSCNFVGLDRNGARLWSGASAALDLNLSNLLFLRGEVDEAAACFQGEKAREGWLLFPDPHPPSRQSEKRLTAPRYLRLYRELLTETATIRLKTDDRKLFDYTLEAVKREGGTLRTVVQDLWRRRARPAPAEIQSPYEQRYRREGRAIYYVCFTLGGGRADKL